MCTAYSHHLYNTEVHSKGIYYLYITILSMYTYIIYMGKKYRVKLQCINIPSSASPLLYT